MFAELTLAASLLLASAQGVTPVSSPDDLAVVKGHYVTAAYEEALAYVTGLTAPRVTPEIEQYRALCLMALGRTEEGQQSFERVVRRAPLYVIPESDISPRMLALFRDVRRRVLPMVARDLYTNGKANFDQKQYESARTELRQLMGLLGDPDVAANGAALDDMRQLADGFLRLAEAEIDRATQAAAAAAAAAAPAPPVAPPAAEPVAVASGPRRDDGLVVTKIVVYSRTDRDVTPPVEVQRFMPPWAPATANARRTEYRGELEVVVNETGRVEQARMLRPSSPLYDVALIGATDGWRFEPARLNGAAVKYLLTFEFVLAPRP